MYIKELVESSQKQVVLSTSILFDAFVGGLRLLSFAGETTWVRKMIREFDGAAKKKGVRIINFAGFDSIPSDLGVLLVTEHIKKTYNK